MGSLISKLLYQPPDASYDASSHPELIWLETKSGSSLPALFIDRDCPMTLLFSHGNAEDIGMIYEWFKELSKQIGVNVFLYEYEGYGMSTGNRTFNTENQPNDESLYEDIDAAWNHLVTKMNIAPSSIVIYGRSLGSGPSSYLAERLSKKGTPAAGLILQSPLLSVFRVAFEFRYTLPWDMYPNIDRIAHVTMPIFIIHGTKDEIVPFWNGEELFLACKPKYRAKPYWVEGAGHNNVETYSKSEVNFMSVMKEFLQTVHPQVR